MKTMLPPMCAGVNALPWNTFPPTWSSTWRAWTLFQKLVSCHLLCEVFRSAQSYLFQKEPSTPPSDYSIGPYSAPLSHGPHCLLRVPQGTVCDLGRASSELLAAIWEELIHMDHFALFSTQEHHNQKRSDRWALGECFQALHGG